MIPIKTSERTVEVNILHELAKCFENNGKRTVTIIAPNQIEEKDLGYDHIFEGLAKGRIIALQFKGPKEGNDDYAQFQISIRQRNVLRRIFQARNQAYYVFAPFPKVGEFIAASSEILEKSSIVDIWNDDLTTTPSRSQFSVKVQKTDATMIVTLQGQDVKGSKKTISLCEQMRKNAIGKPFDPKEI